MNKAWLISAALAAAGSASADETYSTFGADWDYSLAWDVIGQTMTTPDEATILESFEFVAKAYANPINYVITAYDWDDEGQHAVGAPYFIKPGWMDVGDDPLRHHDIDELLPPNQKIAVVVILDNVLGGHGVGVTPDVFEGGSAIATNGLIEDPWAISEAELYDLLFEAEWTVCTADVYQDGMLNIFDFLAFQGLYNAGDPKADFNGDGVTNILDFVAFQSAFLEGC